MRPGEAAGEPNDEAAEDEKHEGKGGGVFDGADGLMADAGERGLVVEFADGREEDAKAVGARAEDLSGAGVGEEDGAVVAGLDLGGLVGVGEDREAGERLRRCGGGGVGEKI